MRMNKVIQEVECVDLVEEDQQEEEIPVKYSALKNASVSVIYPNSVLIDEEAARLEGGDDDTKEKADGVIDSAEFLSRVPADWDLAEKHGNANMVVDSAMLILHLEQTDTYCPCCQLPYPDEEHFFGLCSPNSTLGDLGPGFPLFFEFLKYNIYLLLFLSFAYFIPAIAFIGIAYKELGKPKANEHPLALMSIGAFLRGAEEMEDR